MCPIKRLVIVITGILLLLGGDVSAADKLPVFVSIVPQKYFVQQIGKDLVDAQVMVQPGASPATYEPKPKQMADLSKTKIYFAIGVPFENAWLKKIAAANPNMRVIHTDHGIEKLEMEAHHHHDDHEKGEHHGEEEHGHEKGEHHGEEKHAHEKGEHHGEAEHGHEKGEHHEESEHDKDHHEHTGLDPHIWLSPPLVKIQAQTILAALQEADPAHRSVYEANFKAFTAQIDRLDADLKKTFAGKTGLQFMVFHPSWGYFAHAYGLKQVPIEIEGKDPKPAQLKELIQHAREKGIKVVFVQPQFSTKSAKLVAKEIGGQVVFVDPLAEDWMTNLREVANKFQSALK
ncbi:MAG: zinc ABC transporter substrate-binding protein [Desulfobacterales bacterium]|nr:zinc ABC transporter substrate-binding protein [Desulfobacterales bacterium]